MEMAESDKLEKWEQDAITIRECNPRPQIVGPEGLTRFEYRAYLLWCNGIISEAQLKSVFSGTADKNFDPLPK